jgi:hypothetical protein
VAFISCRRRQTKVLAGVARGKKGSKGGGRLNEVIEFDTGRLSGLKYKLIYCFKLAVDMVGGCIREIVNDMDQPALLERELMGLGMDRYR